VATNHAKDCGTNPCGDQAFLDTLANLRAAGIEPVGGGVDLAEARRPAVVTAGGVRFAVLGYDDIAPSAYGATETSPGTAPLDGDTLAEDVAAALDRADVVIVMPHWGSEYTALPSERQQELARQAIDAGATLVVGNHAHVLQAVEWFDEGFVAYGLGNFVFDQDWSLETQQGAVLEATFHGPRLVGVRLHPVHIHDMHQPRWASADEARSILRRVQDASQAVAAFR
jgi:poly-gamma-glutamate capsule biosynthesis protein CapA/YwtB (metallophosphatase superfamily)